MPFYVDVCFIRLDFESFQLTGPPAVTDASPPQQTEGICAEESLIIGNLEKICGTNTGQHGKYEFVWFPHYQF